jgi:hypothetical protein
LCFHFLVLYSLSSSYLFFCFKFQFAVIDLPGSVLAQSVANSRSFYPKPSPNFLHLDSGCTVARDEDAHGQQRWVLTHVDHGELLVPEKMYTVAIYQFLLTGLNSIEPLTSYLASVSSKTTTKEEGEAAAAAAAAEAPPPPTADAMRDAHSSSSTSTTAPAVVTIPALDACRPAKDLVLEVCLKDAWRRFVGIPPGLDNNKNTQGDDDDDDDGGGDQDGDDGGDDGDDDDEQGVASCTDPTADSNEDLFEVGLKKILVKAGRGRLDGCISLQDMEACFTATSTLRGGGSGGDTASGGNGRGGGGGDGGGGGASCHGLVMHMFRTLGLENDDGLVSCKDLTALTMKSQKKGHCATSSFFSRPRCPTQEQETTS